MSKRNTVSRKAKRKARQHLTPRQKGARVRGLAAINGIRKGEYKNVSRAAKAEGTTVESIRELLPAALIPSRPGKRIRVKAADPYSAAVEILTDTGPQVVIARGSRQRELAGRHRAIYRRVLRGKESASVLEQFRDKIVGGQILISDYDQLLLLARAGVLGQLDTLYVSPDASS